MTGLEVWHISDISNNYNANNKIVYEENLKQPKLKENFNLWIKVYVIM